MMYLPFLRRSASADGTSKRSIMMRMMRFAPPSTACLAALLTLSASSWAQSPYIYRINSGGGASGSLAADQYFSTTNSSQTTGVNGTIDTSSVSSPLTTSAYRSIRYAFNGSPVRYTFPNLTAGQLYRVRLHFYEIYNDWTHTQSVNINGQDYLSSFDIGGTNKVSVHDFTAAANAQGQLIVSINGGNRSPFLSAIEVLNVRAVYVSPSGSDTAAGTISAPLKSLAGARDFIRNLKTAGQYTTPITVYFREGAYYQTSTATFTSQDSGTADNRIIYEAYPGETPIISGGKRITGWVLTTLDGKSVWKVNIPEVANGTWYFRDIWVNGLRRQRARTPDTGVFTKADDYAEPAGVVYGFKYAGTNLDALAGSPDVTNRNAEAVAFEQFFDSHMPLASVNNNTKIVTFDKKANKNGSVASGEAVLTYWVENTRSGLNLPGEWYLDKASGDLYYIPKSGETFTNTTIVAPVLTKVVSLAGNPGSSQFITDLIFRKMTFAHNQWWFPANFRATTGYFPLEDIWALGVYEIGGGNNVRFPGAVEANGLRYVTFDRNNFRNIATYALDLILGNQYNRIDGNKINDVAGGIRLGPRLSDTAAIASPTRDNIIADNTIWDGGHRFAGAVGINWLQTQSNLITHNTIYDFNFGGISGGWREGTYDSVSRDNVISYNDIHHVGRNRNILSVPVMDDLAGIYLYDVQPGTIIDNNRVYSVVAVPRWKYGGFGIYLDQGSKDTVVRNNVAYRNQTANVHMWKGTNNVVENNIFAFGTDNQLRVGFLNSPQTVRRNIFYYAGGGQTGNPKLYRFNAWYDVRSSLVSDYNLYFNTNGSSNGYWAGNAYNGDKPYDVTSTFWKDSVNGFGFDKNSVFNVDPLFVDPAGDEYRFQSGTTVGSLIGFNTAAIRFYFGARY